jgi:hypothetical protein
MLALINTLSDKPYWTQKVFKESIIVKWKQEAMEIDWKKAGIRYGDMNESMFEYVRCFDRLSSCLMQQLQCVSELQDKAAFYEKHSIMPILDVSACVLKSDDAVPLDLKKALKQAVSPLENVPDVQKDWHPGSEGRVLDLVHPSLFPLIYNRSRILPDTTVTREDCLYSIGTGNTIHLLEGSQVDQTFWSAKFQWLPCDVSFPDGENAKIESYINNLHPVDHGDLYDVIEKLITKAVPLWNIVMQWHHEGISEGARVPCDTVDNTWPEDLPDQPPLDEFLDLDLHRDRDLSREEEEEEEEEVSHSQIEWERYKAWKHKHQVLVRPEPRAYTSLSYTNEEAAEVLKDRFSFLEVGQKKIQVIVKLANIHLTPENPEYRGGSWHVEGQRNEHIAASTLYYYDSENVTDSYLSFRTRVDAERLLCDLQYEQGDTAGIEAVFGIENESPNFQDMGSILTREDRMIAFANGFQHRVGSFRLADATKPGHRKIVALFLVDPESPIISTTNVPPQQRDWWLREISAQQSKVGNLPVELVDMIGEHVEDFPIGLEEAKELRMELMAERGMMDKNVEKEMYDYSFSFCEH